MEVEYLKSFSKDLDKITLKSTKESFFQLISIVESASNSLEIPQLKKLRGYKSAYRIRIGDYRVGIFIDGNVVQFAHVLHRKDIYKVFP